MPDIIPNWHPLLVHFPIALIAVSALFTLLAVLPRGEPWRAEWAAAGRLTLRLGALAAVAAAAAGWQAFNTVSHDDAGHAAMLVHRGWALASLALIVLLALWDVLRARAGKGAHGAFAAMLVLALGGVAVTAWAGGELVYRHGLGVMALPQADEEAGGGHEHGDHAHDHGATPH